MERKHTPGPLEARRNVGVTLGSDRLGYVVGSNNVYTALVGTKEDAELYAAAPDLLIAARKALARLMAITNSYPVKHADKVVIARLETAIAKATGGA